MAKKKIPTEATPEEEAEFWPSTSLTDVIAELEFVEAQVSKQPSVTFAVRLDPDVVALIREAARREGVGPTQLVRSWVLERLQLEAKAGALAPEDDDPADAELRRRVLAAMLESLPGVGERVMKGLKEP